MIILKESNFINSIFSWYIYTLQYLILTIDTKATKLTNLFIINSLQEILKTIPLAFTKLRKTLKQHKKWKRIFCWPFYNNSPIIFQNPLCWQRSYPNSGHWFLFIHPENIRKTMDFLMFSGGIEKWKWPKIR